MQLVCKNMVGKRDRHENLRKVAGGSRSDVLKDHTFYSKK